VIPLLLAIALPQVADSGILVIRQDSTLVARESFHTSPDPTSGGWILDANVRYDRSRPVVQLVPIVQIGPDTSAVKVQFDAGDPGAPLHILGQLGRHRFTLRYVSRNQERARELPDPGRAVIVDDWCSRSLRRLPGCSGVERAGWPPFSHAPGLPKRGRSGMRD
jgi:hypothetical protein